MQVSYPLKDTEILFPVTAPKVEGYTLKNWETIIGSKVGQSNNIEGITCEPEELITFEPTNITIGDCINQNGRKITISGKCTGPNILLYNYEVYISLTLDDSDGDFAKCYYKETSSEFNCDYAGKGRIKIKEQYISVFLGALKMKEYDSGQSISSCTDDDDIIDEFFHQYLSADSLYFLNKILILFSFLLF